jgi:hypothetical protein
MRTDASGHADQRVTMLSQRSYRGGWEWQVHLKPQYNPFKEMQFSALRDRTKRLFGLSPFFRNCILVNRTRLCPCTNTAARSAASVLRCCVVWRTPTAIWNVRNAGPMRWNGCYRLSLPAGAVRPVPVGSLERVRERPVRPSTVRTPITPAALSVHAPDRAPPATGSARPPSGTRPSGHRTAN